MEQQALQGLCAGLVVGSAMGLASTEALGQSLYVFSTVPGYRSAVLSGISDDGTKTSGWHTDGAGSVNAFWGTTAGVRVDFGFDPNLPPISFSSSTSRNGDVVVGTSQEYRDNSKRAYRYRASSNTFESLGLFSGVRTTEAAGSNRDGTVVVGWGSTQFGTDYAFRWREGSGYTSLNIPTSRSEAVTADGSTVLVSIATAAGGAYLWAADGSVTALQVPQDGRPWYTAGFGMNDNASVIVGSTSLIQAGEVSQAAAWRGGQIELLGYFMNLPTSARFTNQDGSVISGDIVLNGNTTSFIWTQDLGMLSMADYLGRYGITPGAGWEFRQCKGLSSDGRTISGNIVSARGEARGFVATIPTPWSLMAVLGGLVTACRRRP